MILGRLNIRIILVLCLSISPFLTYAQNSAVSQSDLSQIQVDQLTDEQVASFYKKAEESGMSEQQLEAAALQRGMPATEVEKLRKRIEKLRNGKASTSDNDKFRDRTRSYSSTDENKVGNKNRLFEGKTQTEIEDSIDLAKTTGETDLFGTLGKKKIKKEVRPEDKIFGFAIFKNKKLSFEPNLNIATPQNYVLGPGDEIIIDIWGASQQTYQEKINPEGNIIISNIGPVYLNGLTIEEAGFKLKKELSKIYAGLRAGNTSLKLSLGAVRSIKVNIVGDISIPGTYTLPSLATVFNALYAAGGPALNGTLRSVRLIRDNKTIADLDFYDYLLKGEQKDNVRLQDQDVIFINPYFNRVEVKGEVKRPLLYDVKANESLKDLVYFAGGFTGKAYSQRMKVIRKTGRENKVFDVAALNADTFKLYNGDEVTVDSVLNRFENRVEIKGAVYRSGIFAVENGITLKQLIDKADGLRGDAFKNRATIYRTREDLTMEVLSIDLGAVLAGSANDILLQREDIIWIPSIFDLKEEFTLQIDGEVKKPGIYPFVANSTIEDVIVRCGGLLESASYARLEVARRIKNVMAENSSDKIAEIFQFQISQDLKLTGDASKFTLQPFDQIFIRRSPGYETQALVKLEGEVAFTGSYSIATKTEHISDLIKRAGGLTPEAYPRGARLVRQLPVDEKRTAALKAIIASSKDSVKIKDIYTSNETAIGIELDRILANPHSNLDIIMQEGDVLKVPKQLQTVRLSGAVIYPVTVRYDKSYRFRSYISRSGGFAQEAKKSKSYVIYANGSIDQTRKIFFFNKYPRIGPGAEIIVPKKTERKGMSTGEVVGISSAMASMSLIIITIVNTIKW